MHCTVIDDQPHCAIIMHERNLYHTSVLRSGNVHQVLGLSVSLIFGGPLAEGVEGIPSSFADIGGLVASGEETAAA